MTINIPEQFGTIYMNNKNVTNLPKTFIIGGNICI